MTAPEQMRADAWVKPYCDWRRDVGPIIANDGSAEAGFEAGWQAALSTRPATDELVEALDTLEKLRADLAEENADLHAQRIAVIDLTVEQCRTALRNTGAVL